jgi:prevent-host-death family protein
MEITAKELRGKPGHIIEQAARGTEVVITLRGKKIARLIPYHNINVKDHKNDIGDDIFGLWRDKDNIDNVDDYIRSIRKGRTF